MMWNLWIKNMKEKLQELITKRYTRPHLRIVAVFGQTSNFFCKISLELMTV